MSDSADMCEVLTTIFTAPGQAALAAEAGYRKIWVEWLENLKAMAGAGSPFSLFQAAQSLAPVMKIAGSIELGLTMRMKSVTSGEGKLTLGTGPISFGGSFSREQTSESTMSIRGSFMLANQEVTLSDYLKQHSISIHDDATFNAAVTSLK